MKNILISGSTGFVGSYLKKKFQADGYETFDLNRKDFLLNDNEFSQKFKDIDVVVNLAGAPIIGKWTKKYQDIIYKSRIDTTNKIVKTISSLKNKPELYINASAVGVYEQYKSHSEDSQNLDKGFLGKVVGDWEKEALENIDNCRTIITRFGIILGNGGFLKKMTNIFKYGIGGKIGSGDFIMNFVDIEDVYRFYKYSIENKNINGIYNLSNINIDNKKFTKLFGNSINRPTILIIPKFALRFLYGKGASVILSSLEVFSNRTIASGFKFIGNNLNDIFKKYI